MGIIFLYVTWGIFALLMIANLVKEFIFFKNRKTKINLFVDSLHSTMYVSPNKKTTDEELQKIIEEYKDTYQVKIIEPNQNITGINKYVVDFTHNKKESWIWLNQYSN